MSALASPEGDRVELSRSGLYPSHVRPRAAAARRGLLPGWLAVMAASLGVYLLAAWYLALGLRTYVGDALGRTAAAQYVVLSRDPHLAAVGFTWNPMPSLVQIPLVLALRPFQVQALAGPVQSAVFMAGTVALLWQFLGFFPLPRWVRTGLVALFTLNPMIVLYAANGMSEAMFIFFLMGAIYFFARWVRGDGHPALIAMAFMTAGAFGARYEALPFAVAGVVVVVVAFLNGHDLEPPRLEAMLLTYLVPVTYTAFLWVFFNWLIMSDPLFFLRGTASNLAQTSAFRESGSYLEGIVGSIVPSLLYAGERLQANFLAFGGLLLATGLLVFLRRSWQLLCLLVLATAVPLFHIYLLYSGASFGWLRFFMFSIPAAFVLAPAFIAELRDFGARRLAMGAVLLTFLVSDVAGVWFMAQPDLGREEHHFLERIVNPALPLPNARTFAEDQAVAAYVDQNLPAQRVLLDTLFGFAIVLFAEHPQRYVITNDRDFQSVLDHPGGQVDYVLVRPTPSDQRDYVNTRYEKLYDGGVPWATLVRDFGGETKWRLFRVAPGASPSGVSQ